ncbi:hypothetical protein [Streptomyces sp. NPDC127190]|uniref:hypothetical protein n=1 Tax=unclassified Streptomyces TaxID=2593676 RepID=UPI003626FB4E
MKARTIATGLLAAATLSLTACSGSDSPAAPAKPKTLPGTVQATPAHLTAKQAAAVLAEATGVTTLGNPTDNTASCSEKAAGREPAPASDCLQLITTDTVSIYEYPAPRIAAHRVEFMASKDWQQVGRFALAWNTRNQKRTDAARRAELVQALQVVTAARP